MSTITTMAPQAGQLASRRRVRLTRRGRFVVVLFIATLLLAAFSLGRVSLQASTGEPPAKAYETVVVGPGDTLWGIAKQAVPGVDPRVTVARIVALNGLANATVQPGQELALPS